MGVKSKMKKQLLILVFLFNGILYPQLNFYSSIDSYIDDNIYNNYLNTSDFINSFSFGAGYDIISEINNLELYYDGNLNYFTQNSFKSSSMHKAGIVNSFYIGGNNPLTIGANYGLRIYDDDYNLYDWSNLSGYANYRQYISDDDFFLTGYIFSRTDYPNLNLFSFDEHRGFLKVRFAFPSKTSLLFGIEGGFKNYLEQSNMNRATNSVSQLRGFLQVAQSLGEATGLSGFVQLRKNIKSGNRYVNFNEFSYYEEELIYDQYSNEGYAGGIKLTQLIIPSIILNGFVNYSYRDYLNLPAADLIGNELNFTREDKQLKYGFGLEASLGIIIERLYGNINWLMINNSSNDLFYDYNNQVFSAGLEFNF